MNHQAAFTTLRGLMGLAARGGLPGAPGLGQLGVSEPAVRALRWLVGGAVLRLGLDPAFPHGRWPARVRCPETGEPIQVECVAGRPGRMQAAAATLFNPSRTDANGSLTALMQSRNDGRRWFALTAGHVLAAGGEAGLGERQVLRLDGQPGDFNARIDNFVPSFFEPGADTTIDAGLATMDEEQARSLIGAGLEQPTGTASLYGGGLGISLRAAGQARPGYTVHDQACCWMGLNGLARCDYRLVDAVVYQCDGGTFGGDSGAALWDAGERLVGMHIGSAPDGAGGNAVAMPILQVLQHWPDLRVATRAGTSPVAPPPRPAVAVPPVAPPAPVATVTQEIDVLARTLWGEARGEPDPRAGMGAVACVVLNRVRRQTYWGASVVDVCLKPYQFSCWNAGDPNRPRLTRIDASDPMFALALQLARDALDQRLVDATRGATHYHARTLARPPSWTRGRASCAVIGNHLFFNDVP